jgi:hypothetical protein
MVANAEPTVDDIVREISDGHADESSWLATPMAVLVVIDVPAIRRTVNLGVGKVWLERRPTFGDLPQKLIATGWLIDGAELALEICDARENVRIAEAIELWH